MKKSIQEIRAEAELPLICHSYPSGSRWIFPTA